MTSPPEKLAASIGHQCQNDHGMLADVALLQLATGETDILCQPCLLTMMAAVVASMPDPDAVYEPKHAATGDESAAQLATEAAAAALAG